MEVKSRKSRDVRMRKVRVVLPRARRGNKAGIVRSIGGTDELEGNNDISYASTHRAAMLSIEESRLLNQLVNEDAVRCA